MSFFDLAGRHKPLPVRQQGIVSIDVNERDGGSVCTTSLITFGKPFASSPELAKAGRNEGSRKIPSRQAIKQKLCR
jgi:hypothetical protein